MFSAVPSLNSTLPNHRPAFEIFTANIRIIDEMFKSGNISREYLKSKQRDLRSVSSKDGYFEQPNPITDFLNDIDQDKDHAILITESRLYDVVLDDWFQDQSDYLMMEGRLPNDGHDAKIDMFNHVSKLAQAMKLLGIEKITPENQDLWREFILTKDPSAVIGRDALPLVKVENGFSFPSPKFLAFCAVINTYNELTNHSHHP